MHGAECPYCGGKKNKETGEYQAKRVFWHITKTSAKNRLLKHLMSHHMMSAEVADREAETAKMRND